MLESTVGGQEEFMYKIKIYEATEADYKVVAHLVKSLLIELEPDTVTELEKIDMETTSQNLLNTSKICAFLAKHNDKPIGLITLHECAAIYAGGIYGEISELYVAHDYHPVK